MMKEAKCEWKLQHEVIFNYYKAKLNLLYYVFLFIFSYETDLGIKKDEVGTLKAVPGEGNAPAEPAIVAQGSYSYRGADGKLYKVEYTADENGYNPKFSVSRR